MQRYSEYKDSGVQWLGEIPSHWEVRKMKFTFQERSKKGYPLLPLLAATQNHGVIRKENYENRTVEATKGLETLKLVEEGDFVISLRSFQGGIEICHEKGIISPAYTILRPTNIGKRYFKHLGKSPIFIQLLKSMVTGIREGQNIDYGKLRDNLLPIPSVNEQETIANYLDSVTSKIDMAIAQQQKMIDLLNERKQIIINNAVTTGLNLNVKMKDSGVEWIGEIPEHWEVRRLKHIAKLQSGETISSDYFTEDGYPVFGGNGFRGFTNRYTNEGDYVLIGRQGALCGNVNYAYGRFYASEHAVVVYPYKLENIVWLGEVIRASNLNQYSQSAAQPGLAVSLIQNICYPYPPYEEREKIALFIERQIKAIEDVVKNYQRQIFLLQERKQIIINDVVTGKVKVV